MPALQRGWKLMMVLCIAAVVAVEQAGLTATTSESKILILVNNKAE